MDQAPRSAPKARERYGSARGALGSAEVMVMRASARRARPLRRLGRLFLERNELRRPADRIEAAVIAFLTAAFLTAVVVAACLAGHLYQSQHAAAARLRPDVAVLSQSGPMAATPAAAARARWRLPDGTQRSGTLTTTTAPAISYAPAGTWVQIWLDRSGEPEAPPPSPIEVILTALIAGFATTIGAALVLTLCYHGCRMVLDLHRLRRWESAWAAVGPRWSSRR
jgi:multisubunit Na+/H+ antiporter MnhC subunit